MRSGRSHAQIDDRFQFYADYPGALPAGQPDQLQ